MRLVNGVGGLGLTDVRAQPQSIVGFPAEVAKLGRSRLTGPMSSHQYFAITLAAITRRRHAVRPVREQNGLNPSAVLVIDGCCKDYVLENLWQRRRNYTLYQLLEAEEPCILVAPDMSVYTDMPACQKVYEIKRTFEMYGRYQRHGLTAIPFLSPDNEAHAEHLAAWLAANKCVTYVATSFQTFRGRKGRFRRHMGLLQQIRERVPRDLVWIVIGQRERRRRTFEAGLGAVRFVTAAPRFDAWHQPREELRELPF